MAALAVLGAVLVGAGCATAPVAAPPPGGFAAPTAELRADVEGRGAFVAEALFDLAVAHSPVIAGARADVEAAEGRLRQARLYPNPSVEARAASVDAGSLSTSGARAAATVTQPVIIGPRRAREIQWRRAELEAARERLAAVERRVLARVYTDYEELLHYRESLVTFERLLGRLDDLVREVPGTASAADVDRLRNIADELALDVTRFGAEELYAADRIGRDLGGARPAPSAFRGRLLRGLDASLFEYMDVRHAASHPARQAALAAIRAQELAPGVERGRVIPDIDVFAGIEYDNRLDDEFLLGGVRVPLPAWDRRQGLVDAAEATARRARSDLLLVESELEHDLRHAIHLLNEWDTLHTEYSQFLVPRALAVFEDAEAAYRGGDVPVVDVVEAARALVEAEAGRLRYLRLLNLAAVELWDRASAAAPFHVVEL